MTDVYCRDCKEFGPAEIDWNCDGINICGNCSSDNTISDDDFVTECKYRQEGER